jgi:hypothetical protein
MSDGPHATAKPDDPPRWLDWIDIDKIEYAPRNPKEHDLEGIGASFDEHGVVEVPALDERTGRLVAGHGRIERMRQARDAGQSPPDGLVVGPDGVWRAGVIRGWRSHSDAQASSYLLASNNLTTRGGWNDAGLLDMLTAVRDADVRLLAATGFDDGTIADLAAAMAAPDIEAAARTLGERGSAGELWRNLVLPLPALLHVRWKEHLARYDDDVVLAFAALLDVDPAELSEDEAQAG